MRSDLRSDLLLLLLHPFLLHTNFLHMFLSFLLPHVLTLLLVVHSLLCLQLYRGLLLYRGPLVNLVLHPLCSCCGVHQTLVPIEHIRMVLRALQMVLLVRRARVSGMPLLLHLRPCCEEAADGTCEYSPQNLVVVIGLKDLLHFLYHILTSPLLQLLQSSACFWCDRYHRTFRGSIVQV